MIRGSLIMPAKYFVAMIKASRRLNSESTLVLNEQGIQVKTIEPSHISLLTFTYNVDGLKEYILNNNEPLKYCISINDILKFAQRLKGDIAIILSKNKDGEQITITNNNIKYVMWLYDHNHSIEVPKLKFTHAFIIDSKEIAHAVKDISKFSENIVFEYKNGTLHLRSYDIYNSSVNKIEASFPVESKGKHVASVFNANIVAKILCALKNTTKYITVHMADNYPIAFEYLFDFGNIVYYVAPKLESGVKK